MSHEVTPERLRPHLEEWLAAAPSRPVFAVHHVGEWTGKPQLSVGGRNVDVAVCPSELAVREELSKPRDDQRSLVLLTAAEQLGGDVLARLAKPRVHRLHNTEALLPLFGVRSIDPEIARVRWLPDALVDSAPPEGYGATGSVQLDLDRAWRALLGHRHGIQVEDGLPGLLRWASGPGTRRLLGAPEAERVAVTERLEGSLPGSGGLLAAVLAGHGGEAIPLGLVLRVLVAADDGPDRVAARTRFEVHLNGWSIADAAAGAWAQAAETELAQLDRAEQRSHQRRADQLVAMVKAESLLIASDVLEAGLAQRLAAFGRGIDGHLDGGDGLDAVVAAAHLVGRHQLADHSDDAVPAMATRLTRWLAADAVEPTQLLAAASRYVADGASADRARATVRRGGGEPTLDAALRRLVAAADARREREEARFAELLAGWLPHAAPDDALMGVEGVLDRIVAPIATEKPVLFAVLDGMSHRVACELLADLGAEGWVELRRAGDSRRALALAALPSVTGYSRSSLLGGRLAPGAAKDEARWFAEHGALTAASATGGAPRLFHKGTLGDPDGGLTTELRSEIAGDRRIVGVVVNAIDDHLARSDQLRMTWGVADILPLRWLLDAAQDAGRVVILASDHGHVLERGGEFRNVSGKHGERWRESVCDDPSEGEVYVSGTRVLTGGSAILAWSERVRYSPKKHGYHGGASAQEVMAPVVVLTSVVGDTLEGWVEAPYDVPEWWAGDADAPAEPAPVVAPEPGEQLEIGTEGPGPASWISALLGSDVFAAQRATAGRTPISDERVIRILSTLDAHDGVMLFDALARACAIPPIRLTGTLAALRQVLNVDGYAVLSVDDTGADIRLDVGLLRTQFGLDGG